MRRNDRVGLGPSLLAGAGIILSTLIAVRSASSGLWVLAGPLFLALTVLSADGLRARLQGGTARPSWRALVGASAIVAAGAIVGVAGSDHLGAIIPLLGSVAWTVQFLGEDGREGRGGSDLNPGERETCLRD